MSQNRTRLELNFVTTSQVRRYAENRLLAQDAREAVEQALLDDDRARDLVREHAEPQEPEPVPISAKERLEEVLDCCRRALVCYEALARTADVKTVSAFACQRFKDRWVLYEKIRKTVEPHGADDVEVLNGADIDAASLKSVVDQAVRRDGALLSSLERAFQAPCGPKRKADIADWISAVEPGVYQVSWLKSVFSKGAAAGSA